MPIIDHRVALLLDDLRDGGAVAIANAAIERLIAIEPDDDPAEDGVHDGGSLGEAADGGSDDEETSDDGFTRRDPVIALRQLDVADEVVLGRMRLEAALIVAIPEELGLLREAQADRGAGSRFLVDEVILLGDRDDAYPDDGGRATAGVGQLADDAGLRAIHDLEEAWATARDLTKESIRDGG